MTRPQRPARHVSPPAEAGGRATQHISSIAHLFFSEENAEDSQQGTGTSNHRFLVVGSGKSTLAPHLAAGLAREILAAGPRVSREERSGRDAALRQVFLGEPTLVHFSAFSHLPEDTFRAPVPDEAVPWSAHSGVPVVARVFGGVVPGEDFLAGRVRGRYFVRHMDLPRDRALSMMESQRADGQTGEAARDGAQALIWCLTAEEGPSLEVTSRLGRLLRVVQPKALHVVLAHQGQAPGTERQSRVQRLVGFLAPEFPVHWYFLGPEREARISLLKNLTHQLEA